jgi:hypothetical protein
MTNERNPNDKRKAEQGSSRSHPYVGLPGGAYWTRGVARQGAGELDPVLDTPFVIGANEKVATAGSCFAQHIGRYLRADGRNYLETEPAHPLLTAPARMACNYGVYTARYGNIYTARQLRQLVERVYGRFQPQEDVWEESDGRFIDPFRPNIQPGGFNSLREYNQDRARHFAAVRQALETLDVFVFTLGLTEAWRAKADGAVFPVCPGVAGGAFNPARHAFVNFSVEETVEDMRAFIEALRAINPRARLILTVSPVPLAATAEPRHVLTSTIYSKSALRVACETLTRGQERIAYFPAYEIVASGFAGDYFAPDRRSVTEAGVAHVMSVFARHYLERNKRGVLDFVKQAIGVARGADKTQNQEQMALQAAFQTMCDEEALNRLGEIDKPQEAPK